MRKNEHMIYSEKEFMEKCEENAKEFVEAITPTAAEISEILERWFNPLPNYVYPPNCGKRKRHSKLRARQYGRRR